MRLAILGTGNIAQTLVRGRSKAGREVSPPLSRRPVSSCPARTLAVNIRLAR